MGFSIGVAALLGVAVLAPAAGAAEAPPAAAAEARPRARGIGLAPGVLPAGPLNAITDVAGVRVGHVTLIEGAAVRTGVTAVLPHAGNLFQQKVPAAIHVGNGFGKLVGSTQVEELGVIETPIVLTNTLSVWTAADAVVGWTMALPGNEDVRSINPVVGETNDGRLNDIRGRHVKAEHVRRAIRTARGGAVEQGAVGAGTGTVCFGFKGGIGTSSRRLPASLGGHTVGVLVQSNFGGVLTIDGLPVGEELGRYHLREELEGTSGSAAGATAGPAARADGSITIVVATDAPLRAHGLRRLARRAMLGVARTGGISSHGSGDYVIAFSTAPELRVAHAAESRVETGEVLRGEALSPLFQAVIEATEEAIYDSLLQAVTVRGRGGIVVEALPVERLLEIARRHGRRPASRDDPATSRR